jgi:hypothetical protein
MVGLRGFRLPSRSRCELHTSGLLHREQWQFLTDVSGQLLCSLNVTDTSSRNVRNYHYSLRNSPEESSFHGEKPLLRVGPHMCKPRDGGLCGAAGRYSLRGFTPTFGLVLSSGFRNV